jgi:tellurite resistance protein TerC
MSVATPLHWGLFLVLIAGLLALDLGVFHRRPHALRFREAAGWSAFWVALALAFNAFVWVRFGATAGQEFLAGYLIEKALSVDNVFVFLVLFASFGVPAELQHRLLFWGVAGAVVMRAVFVFAGVAALDAFHGLIYLFAAILLWTGLQLLRERDHGAHPERNPLFRLFQRLVPSTPRWHGPAFVVREGGRRLATPMLTVLVLIELTDVVFALDSIPAVFAITRDPFIVLTSNVFAILGLRALTFCLAGLLERLVWLKPALAVVLMFVGAKMALADVVHLPIGVSLGIVAAILGAGIALSLLRPAAHRAGPPGRVDDSDPAALGSGRKKFGS